MERIDRGQSLWKKKNFKYKREFSYQNYIRSLFVGLDLVTIKSRLESPRGYETEKLIKSLTHNHNVFKLTSGLLGHGVYRSLLLC